MSIEKLTFAEPFFQVGGCGQKPGHENTIVKKNEIHQRANHCRADIV